MYEKVISKVQSIVKNVCIYVSLPKGFNTVGIGKNADS
jgi:hypothetical protein